MDDVRVGDFTRDLSPRKAPVKTEAEDTENKLEAEAKAAEDAAKPMTSYEDRLREIGVSREEAARIIDSVLMRGHFSEDVQLTRTIKARFRTRNARDTKRAQEYIEQSRPTYDQHYQELLSRQLLAASLEVFGTDKLPYPDRKASHDEVEKAFGDRLAYVDSLSDPAMRLLLQKLIKFDRKISTVLDEWAVESF